MPLSVLTLLVFGCVQKSTLDPRISITTIFIDDFDILDVELFDLLEDVRRPG